MTFKPKPWESGNPLNRDRDFEAHPYNRQEARVAAYYADLGVGGGNDPVGSMIASNRWLAGEVAAMRKLIKAASLLGVFDREAYPDLIPFLDELDEWRNPFDKEPKS